MLCSFTKNEIVKIYLKNAQKASGGYDSLVNSYIFIRQAYLVAPDDPRILEKFANILFSLRDFNNVLKCCEKWFSASPQGDDSKFRANMFLLRGIAALQLHKFDLASENLRKAMNGFLQENDTGNYEEAKKYYEIELPRTRENPQTKPASEKREECIRVKNYLENSELPDVPGKMVYLLPAEWIERWKEYNNYYEYFHDDNEKPNFMEEEKEKVTYLGPIDPSSILEDDPVLVDIQEDEFYCNFPIKMGLEENKDFYIVNEECWRYLFKKYGGIPVKRPTYRKSENSMSVSVEVWLQKINVVCLPAPRKSQPPTIILDRVFISKRKTTRDLNEKLARVYNNVFLEFDVLKVQNRVWKIDPQFDLKKAYNNWDCNNDFHIKGKILEEGNVIEESEITDEDVVVFEIQFTSKWLLSNEKKNESKGNTVVKFSSIKDFPPGAKKGLTGLQNLGNTCFMNSAIQCLSNTFEVTKFFISDEYKRDINRDNPLGSGGKLAYYYSELMKEMWLGTSSYVSPWELKKCIGRLASQFVGYGQQDSQELLSYLLDGLHEDLNRVLKKPIIETKDDDTRPDEIVAQESWENHLRRNQSRIQELMHGQFRSQLDCPDCKKVSITFDPYMMISLPIPTDEYCKFFIYFVFENDQKIPLKITFNMPSYTSYPDFLSKVSQVTQVPARNIVMALLKEHKIIEFVGSTATVHYLKEHAGILFAYEIPQTSYTLNKKVGSSDADLTNGSLLDSEGTPQRGTSTRDTMETEEDNSSSSSLLQETLIKVAIQAEAKAFYESEKTCSYMRLIKLDTFDTYQDLHLKVYERLRPIIFKYFVKQGMKNPVRLEEHSKAIIQEEYNTIFPEDNEGQWIYKLCMVNTAKEDPKTGKKPPCELCQKAKCTRCQVPFEDTRVSNYLQKMRILPKEMLLEVRIQTKSIKIENLPLNQCSEHRGESDDETNDKRNYNLHDCISLFTKRERLEKENAWYCSKCKSHKEALKKMEIYKLPPVLILHLKRFKTSKASTFGSYFFGHGKKINATVDFPVKGLDLSKYVLNSDKTAIYDLYAVSNHYGGLSGGHYTAYAKNPITGEWYDFNDSRVSRVDEREIVGAAAYVLFYKRRDETQG